MLPLNIKKFSVCCVLSTIPLLLFTALPVYAHSAVDTGFEELQERLIADGKDSVLVRTYFNDPRFSLIQSVLRINVHQPDPTDAYAGMTTDRSVQRTRDFLSENRQVFDRVLAGGDVDPEVVVAILRIESNLGTFPGRYPLMNVFASLTLLESSHLESIAPDFWDNVMNDIPVEEQDSIRERVNSRRARKANWAYRELCVLFDMARDGIIDPLEVNGSWAGAFGLAQFLPSSFQAYARDGNGDSVIDLYNLEDAIASIANYLDENGYRSNSERRRRRAVYSYNHSDHYVNAVLYIRDQLWNDRQAESDEG